MSNSNYRLSCRRLTSVVKSLRQVGVTPIPDTRRGNTVTLHQQSPSRDITLKVNTSGTVSASSVPYLLEWHTLDPSNSLNTPDSLLKHLRLDDDESHNYVTPLGKRPEPKGRRALRALPIDPTHSWDTLIYQRLSRLPGVVCVNTPNHTVTPPHMSLVTPTPPPLSADDKRKQRRAERKGTPYTSPPAPCSYYAVVHTSTTSIVVEKVHQGYLVGQNSPDPVSTPDEVVQRVRTLLEFDQDPKAEHPPQLVTSPEPANPDAVIDTENETKEERRKRRRRERARARRAAARKQRVKQACTRGGTPPTSPVTSTPTVTRTLKRKSKSEPSPRKGKRTTSYPLGTADYNEALVNKLTLPKTKSGALLVLMNAGLTDAACIEALSAHTDHTATPPRIRQQRRAFNRKGVLTTTD